ncbi:MAG: enoyl-ACP reductase FabI [Alphaproteobacteria bacterium]|nr:enoyl-ACP reductase FabI [Alphaproteobacteria bacterium]
MLRGKRALIVGIANESSIAHGCAVAFAGAGAELGITYLNAKAEPHVRPLAEKLNATLIAPLNVEEPGEMEALFERVRTLWGGLDILVHSIAFAPREDLHGRLIDSSRAGFLRAMDVSVHSFLRMAGLAEPMMQHGGCMMTVSYYGAEKVVDHYNLMGPVKAALETACRYLSVELGPRRIRVFALSPGPIRTRAASGIDHFDELVDHAASKSPLSRLVTIEEVGQVATFLASDAASGMTGSRVHIDAGVHVMS